MVDSVILDGTEFTEASFAGDNYANPDTGILAFGAAVVGHGANLHEGESTTSLTIGAGTKIAEITAARPIYPGSYVEFVDAANAANHMGGDVDSYDKVTGDITFTVTDDYAGSGTISDWLVYCQGKRGRQGNPGTPASTTQAGIVELATTEEVQDGTDTVRAVTPAGLSARTATEARTGLVELATTEEVQDGTDTVRAVTPAGLASRTATETRTGIAEIATQVEVDARTDNSRIVTPDKLAHGTGLTGASITAGGTLTLPAVGDDFPVSGTGATITAMSARTPAGRTVRTTMAGANTLVHSSALALFTGANIVTAAGDVIDWKSTAAGWAMIGYERASGAALVGGSLLRTVVFTSSGTWTKGSGTRFIKVRSQAPGGGGRAGPSGAGAATSGGGAGAYGEEFIDVTSISSEVVTIGAAGTGGASADASGSDGGTNTFGSHLTCTGGKGGTSAGGGDGGTATGGDINVSGGGATTLTFGNTIGIGGVSFFGGPPWQPIGNGTNGKNGLAYGCGGNAGNGFGGLGGNGAPGIAIVEEYA